MGKGTRNVSGLVNLIGVGLGLGSDMVNAVLGSQGLFGRTLETVASLNPFRLPGAPPGERAGNMEEHLAQLEALMTNQTGNQQDNDQANLLLEAKLLQLRQLLNDSALLDEERTAVFGKVATYLSNRQVAERLGSVPPEPAKFLEDLENTLSREFRLSAPQVRQLVQDIGQLVSELKWAA